MLIELELGRKFKIDVFDITDPDYSPNLPYFNDGVSRIIRRVGAWEPFETEVFLYLIRAIAEPADLFVDVGTHIGYYTLLHASHGVACLGFEQSAHYADRLERAIAANELSSLIQVTRARVSATRSPGHVTLDDAIPPNLSILALKMDCEGAEPNIVRGGFHLVASRRVKAFVIEVSPRFVGAKSGLARGDYGDMCAHIVAAGYIPIDIGLSAPRRVLLDQNPFSTKAARVLEARTASEFEQEFRRYPQTNFAFIRDDLAPVLLKAT